MNRIILHSLPVILLSAILLTACGMVPSVPSTPSNTPNPCAPGQIGNEIAKISNNMREFDDITFVARLTERNLLTQPILQLQAVRRDTENLNSPSCLWDLKKDAISYMNTVINYLAHFMGGVSEEQVTAELTAGQNLRTTYEAEMARLVGATYVPPATLVPLVPQPQVGQSSAPPGINSFSGTPTPTEVVVLATNPGTASVNIRFEPSMTSAIVGYLQPNESAPAIGRTSNSEWIAIQLTNSPINYAWVYATTVRLNVPLEQLPTPNPTPTITPSTVTPTP